MLLNSPEPFEFHCGFWKMNGLDSIILGNVDSQIAEE